ncbi:uncharacterized protein EV422DRAFT_7103 [Fimicolochytrium jonesii]|uniref:uncharacterized protein n=1 Tax=Fimicolochytrium jonesii TaxID=1396493 RepID=UPI0022FF15BD|nr:uncharacterized protein EV422DRAFT_7103 [Fimicolochytrium jonesii]KAI8826704.1 hypothetical protein EV422DRAFT_7103 [Fimicolochytrium jonesii]
MAAQANDTAPTAAPGKGEPAADTTEELLNWDDPENYGLAEEDWYGGEFGEDAGIEGTAEGGDLQGSAVAEMSAAASSETVFDTLLEDGVKIGAVVAENGSSAGKAERIPSQSQPSAQPSSDAPSAKVTESHNGLPPTPQSRPQQYPPRRQYNQPQNGIGRPVQTGYRMHGGEQRPLSMQGGRPGAYGHPASGTTLPPRPGFQPQYNAYGGGAGPAVPTGHKIHVNPKFAAMQAARFHPYGAGSPTGPTNQRGNQYMGGQQVMRPMGYNSGPMGNMNVERRVMGAGVGPGINVGAGVGGGMGRGVRMGMSMGVGTGMGSPGNMGMAARGLGRPNQGPPSQNSSFVPGRPDRRLSNASNGHAPLSGNAPQQFRHDAQQSPAGQAPQPSAQQLNAATSVATINDLSASTTAETLTTLAASKGLRVVSVDKKPGETVAKVSFGAPDGARVFRRMFHKTDIEGSRVQITLTADEHYCRKPLPTPSETKKKA